jgi:hypothetical protein
MKLSWIYSFLFVFLQIGPVNFVSASESQFKPMDHDSRNGTMVRSAYLGRYFRHERIPLRQLLGIDSRFQGWQVERVIADVRNARGEQIDLLVNNQLIQYRNAYQGEVYFDFNAGYVIDETVQSLQFGITHDIYIESVRVVLRDPRYNQPRPPPGGGEYEEIRVPVAYARQLYANDYVNLLEGLDLNSYRGYRIYGIQFYATVSHAHSAIDVYLNGYSAGPRLEISRFNNFYEMPFYQGIFLDYNTRVELYNTEPLYIENFSVILRR